MYFFVNVSPPKPFDIVTSNFGGGGGVKRSKFHFSEHGQREWSIEHHAWTYSLLTHTLNPLVGLKGKKNVVMLGIKLMVKKYRQS